MAKLVGWLKLALRKEAMEEEEEDEDTDGLVALKIFMNMKS